MHIVRERYGVVSGIRVSNTTIISPCGSQQHSMSFFSSEQQNFHVSELIGENDKNIIFTGRSASGIESTRHFVWLPFILRPDCDLTSLLYISGTKINESYLAFLRQMEKKKKKKHLADSIGDDFCRSKDFTVRHVLKI